MSDVRKHRIRALEGIASAMVQLGQFSLRSGGRPLFDDNGELAGVGAVLETNWRNAESEVIGPWTSPKKCHSSILHWNRQSNAMNRGMVKMLQAAICCIQGDEPEAFVLSFPDFDFRNILFRKTARF